MNKTPLLLLHGALFNRQQFDPIYPHLSNDLELHRMDLSGHGNESLAGNDFGMGQFARDVLRFMEQHEMNQVDIFGYSMGGYVALYLCHLHPEKVRKVFTLGTKVLWTPESAAMELKRLDPEKMKEKVPAFVAELQNRHPKTGWEAIVKHTREMMLGLGEQPLLNKETLGGISQKVRIAIGDRDISVSADEAAAVYLMLANAELEIMPGTPHPLEKVNCERLAYAIREFFGS